MTNADSKLKESALETLPKELSVIGLQKWIDKKKKAGEIAKIKFNVELEDWASVYPTFEDVDYEWEGDKRHPALIGYPYTNVSLEKVFDPELHNTTVQIKHGLNVHFSFEGKPVIVLGYDEATHCVVVVRGDVYER